MQVNSRFNYRFSKNFNNDEVTKSLAKYGISVIEDFFDTNQLEQIKSEATEILNMKTDSRMEKNLSILQKASINSLDKKKFPMTTSLPKSEFFRYVAKDFFGSYPFIVPLVYIHKDVNKIDFNGAWHQDPQTSVKFYIYLNDVSSRNGALKYNIGSHREGFYRLMYKRHTGDTFPTFGLPEDELLNAESIEGKAGTLIAFNPIGAHTAGQIENEMERFVIRFHFTALRPTSIMKRGYHKLWRTRLNPVKPLVSRDEMFSQKHKSMDFHLNEMKKHE
jgi:ectoine hydroxylase-related dioxygenase (phytanoyl-CoA dioxygenase family)